MPSGQFMAASSYEDNFAMVPVLPNGRIEGCHAWNTKEDAEAYIVMMRKHPKGKKLFDELKAEVGEIFVPIEDLPH